MRPVVLLPVLLAFFLNGYSQIRYEKGYFVNNEDQRTECLIRNVDWDRNPREFFYKMSATGEPLKMTIESVKEFEIYDVAKYLRVTCDLDRSSEEIGRMSRVREPEFSREQLFLRVLVTGKASLYMYTGENLKRFFYSVDSSSIEPLVYKSYRIGVSEIGKNFMFRQQLLNVLQCDRISENRIRNVSYAQKDLVKIFTDFNVCSGDHSVESLEKEKRDIFSLWLRPRMTRTSFKAVREQVVPVRDLVFDDQVSFTAGIEAEFILPFRKSKWALTIEPTYHSYNASIPSVPIVLNYKAIDLPIGVRHYFFISSRSKISLAGAFQLNFRSSKSILLEGVARRWDVKPSHGLVFEIGYVYKNRLGISYRYNLPREILRNRAWESDFGVMSIILGYSIF